MKNFLVMAQSKQLFKQTIFSTFSAINILFITGYRNEALNDISIKRYLPILREV